MANVEEVLKNFDASNGVFSFGKNRHGRKFRVEMPNDTLYDKPLTDDERRQEEKKEADEYTKSIKEKFAAESNLINKIGKDTWESSKRKFRTGDAYKMTFLDDEEPTLRKNRFSNDAINFNQSFRQIREKRIQEEKIANDINRDLNKLERQHMEYNTKISDRATRRTMKEWRHNEYADRSTDKESGDTKRLTKLHSAQENAEILANLRDDRGPVRLYMSTTIASDNDGDQREIGDALSDKNIKHNDTITEDRAKYKEEVTTYDSTS